MRMDTFFNAHNKNGTLCSTPADGTRHGPDRSIGQTQWQLAQECPIAFIYNTTPHAVMMATPQDLDDYALGFSITEEVIDRPNAIMLTKINDQGLGKSLYIAVDPDHLGRGYASHRTMAGRTGCGLCGIDELKDAVRTFDKQPPMRFTPDSRAINRALNALSFHQPMNQLNRSIHAAAWCEPNGNILICREDVGRHNALDKLVGAVHKAELDPGAGFVIMSSRCSFELVQKCAAAGIPLLATISAPTALAVELAKKAGIRLAALSAHDEIIMFETD